MAFYCINEVRIQTANTQRIIPDAILCSNMFITAKTAVRLAYENTIIGKYLLTFFVTSIISTII
jgi:hypothetical protein